MSALTPSRNWFLAVLFLVKTAMHLLKSFELIALAAVSLRGCHFCKFLSEEGPAGFNNLTMKSSISAVQTRKLLDSSRACRNPPDKSTDALWQAIKTQEFEPTLSQLASGL